jgi:GTP-binding protein HflX
LVEAFKATLEEAVLADFLIHVLDATAPEVERFHRTTLEVLAELGARDKTVLTVLNKVDLAAGPDALAALERKFPGAILLSAATGHGAEHLLRRCCEVLADRVRCRQFRIPQRRADLVSLLHREGKVVATAYEGDDVLVTAVVPATVGGKLAPFLLPGGNSA